MIVWLDDLRDPKDYGYPDALWFKTSQKFMDFLDNRSKFYRYVTEWHFDNDLGEDSEIEGYDCLLALEEKLVYGKLPVHDAKLYVHTSNPSAAQKFMLAKESFSKYRITILRNNY